MAVVVSIDKSFENEISQVFDLQKKRAVQLRSESLKNRIDRLTLLEKWILNNREAIQDAIYDDYRKPYEESGFSEIFPVVSEIRYVKKNLKKWASNKKVDTPLLLFGSSSLIKHEPKGVILIIAPWNYPFMLLMSPLISAIAAGNTAILKPSEITPKISGLMGEMIVELFNKNEVALFEGGVTISKFLLSLPFDHIFYTGSSEVGKIVMKAAAENLASVTLELGGKSPTIVDETANIKIAAQRIAWGKLLNTGQSCVAPDYILVHEKVKHQLVNELKKQMNLMYGQDNEQYKHALSYGRIVNESHFDRLQKLIDDAIDKGAKVICGGETEKKSRYVAPMILTQVTPDMEIMKEEVFGPVLPIIEYNDIDKAIDFINERPKALALYIFSKSKKNQRKVLSNTSSGAVCINENMVHFAHQNLPFGGINNSGVGKAHGYYGFMSFTNEKAILKQWSPISSSKFLYPPFTHLKKKILDLMIKYF